MKANINNPSRHYEQLPNKYGNVPNRYFDFTDRHYADGWRDVVEQTIDYDTQRFDGDWHVTTIDGSEVITIDVVDLTQEELDVKLDDKIKTTRNIIYNTTDALFLSAKARALGKTGQNLSREQLDDLEQIYDKKKNDAQAIISGGNVNQIVIDLIDFEQQNDFTGAKLDQTIAYVNSLGASIDTNASRLHQYCGLILFKHAVGSQEFDAFKAMIENFRSRLLTNLEKLEFEKLVLRLQLVEQINNDTTIQEILALNQQFNNI